jgi:branched-chain amino acid transport system substrate-binding protein
VDTIPKKYWQSVRKISVIQIAVEYFCFRELLVKINFMHYKNIYLNCLRVFSLCLLSQVASCTSTASTQGTPTLGVTLSQSSNFALIGQEQVNGVKIAEQYFNQQGGINGQPLRFVFQDAGADEATAINAFQTLINTSRVAGIVGPTTSQQTFSAGPIAERSKTPMIAPSTIAPGIPQLGEFVSRLGTDASFTAPIAVKGALKLNPQIKNVAIFYAQDQEAQVSESKFFQKAIKTEGLNLLPMQKFQVTDTDFQSQASWVIRVKPDLIIVSGLVVDGGNLIKQVRQLGYKGLIVGGNGLNTANIFPVCQMMCDGILVAQAYSPANSNPSNQAFVSAFKKIYQKQPSQLSAQGFSTVQVFVEALRAVDGQQKIATLPLTELRQKLNTQILKGSYDTPLGKIAFTREGDIIQTNFFVAQIKMDSNGKQGNFVFLEK